MKINISVKIIFFVKINWKELQMRKKERKREEIFQES